VLTFDYEREPQVVADLVLCAPVVAREAATQGLPLEATTRTCWCTARCTRRAGTTARRARPRRWRRASRYLPAFEGIASATGATPVQMQQTLSSYLFGFALMNLFHGALSDSTGRRPVVLWGTAIFTAASVGCALADSIGTLILFRTLQGMSAGAGMVISRAIIRDMFGPADAQRLMSQVTIFFGVAPAIAPLIGGWFFVWFGWQAIFWLLAAIGAAIWVANYRLLPESLPPAQRQPLHLGNLMRGYAQLGRNPRLLALILASGVPFNGFFLYVLAAPTFLGELLALEATQFFWFFLITVAGVMGGAWFSGRVAGRIKPRHQIRHGLVIMLAVSLLNVVLSATLAPHPAWALFPLGIYAFGWSLMAPAVTLLTLDQVPERRGMVSSLQSCLGSLANAVVAGVVAPFVMHSMLGLALASAAALGIGLVAWLWVKPRLDPAAGFPA
jgi:MFS transporter, DHA1 family, multidrug resistance protein